MGGADLTSAHFHCPRCGGYFKDEHSCGGTTWYRDGDAWAVAEYRRLRIRAEKAEAENTTLRKRVAALELRSGLYVCDHGCWDVAEVDHTESIPCAYEGHSEMRFYTIDQLARTVFLTDLLTAARHLLDCSQASEPCPKCGGAGEVLLERAEADRRIEEWPECPACHGTGKSEPFEVEALRALERAVAKFEPEPVPTPDQPTRP